MFVMKDWEVYDYWLFIEWIIFCVIDEMLVNGIIL